MMRWLTNNIDRLADKHPDLVFVIVWAWLLILMLLVLVVFVPLDLLGVF